MRVPSSFALLAVLLTTPFCIAQRGETFGGSSKGNIARSSIPVVATGQPVGFSTGQPVVQTTGQPVDLILNEVGELRGRVVDRQGRSLTGVEVSLMGKHGILAAVRSDALGLFAFQAVNAGPKMIRAHKQTQSVRVWKRELAPPSAKPALLLVAGNQTVRAQGCATGPECGGCKTCHAGGLYGQFGGVFQRILRNPWLVGAGTAAAIAIPLATDDDDDRDDDFSQPDGS